MARVGPLIWFWSLTILPFTAILTFISTLIVCIQIPNNAPKDEKFPQISQLGTGQAYPYFVTGFVILSIQLLVILLGRIQYLFQTQYIIHRGIISVVHGIGLLSIVFLLLMAIVSIDDRPSIHLIGAYGLFGFISLYCFLHTVVVVYLFIHRSDVPQHTNIIWPIWFLFCSVLLITFFIVWLLTAKGIPEYLAAATPFLYFLGLAPQFWTQARTKKLDVVLFERLAF
ncbi:unnamed protein product [Rotaria magnacalcarata]|uniref:CWH43-like N-terminal domain-containing protein n=1 Tax=Rotaria magnacalcarata TaxID=392030 RepID=A0A816CMC0_9BILA|nr:unnamed protein product [Rotaria magnacalcarata]CAF1623615.1 unnamed protein product [Rotaria magnacalcarata]CAF2105211.1 unnamed protein product [Rotaria magnacalcarata]CAF2120258.1 unnamed protein product [Rotaria magnacalcarata]CAF2130810.1 unnamed protein product [Rotaria magnacalcarata]